MCESACFLIHSHGQKKITTANLVISNNCGVLSLAELFSDLFSECIP